MLAQHIGYDCLLVQTLQRFFNAITKDDHQWNQSLLEQIFKTLLQLDQFGAADRQSYLKVVYLLFLQQ